MPACRPLERGAGGYTVMELMAVLAILAALAWLALPLAEMSRERAREGELRRGLWEIRDAIDAYKKAVDAQSASGGLASTSVSGYPPTLEALVQGLPDPRTGQVSYFLRRLPRDPFAPPDLPAAQTWGLRAFASPADAPAPGADVYDVYSRAPGAGLDGTPFRTW